MLRDPLMLLVSKKETRLQPAAQIVEVLLVYSVLARLASDRQWHNAEN
jgi:hypothetical protein